MSFRVAEHFIRYRGLESLSKFITYCNEGRNLVFLGAFLGVSPARASKLRAALFVRSYVLKDTTADAVKFHKHVSESDIDDCDLLLKDGKSRAA